MNNMVIETNTLTKYFNKVKAVNEISISIQPNTITGIVGRNGAGKTTFLKMIAGFLKQSSGDINVFSERPFNSLLVANNSIFVDDEMLFPDVLTLREILVEGNRFHKNWDMNVAHKMLYYFSFNPDAVHAQLSKGKKSTFNMLFGLSTRCALTIFDEPTTGMDAAVRKDFYRVLLKDYLAYPRTFLISSHHLDEMEHLLEDVLLIDKGKLLIHMPIDDLQEYAVGLSGSALIMECVLKDQDVLYRETINKNTIFAIVKRGADVENLKRMGIRIAPVSPSDLSIYMTKDFKGGIDDVLK